MRKLKSKILTLVMAMILSITVQIPNIYVHAGEVNIQEFTVESYKDWIKLNVDSEYANDFLKEFNALTSDEQELFITYLNDVDLIAEIFNAIFNTYDSVTLGKGDINISSSFSYQNENAENEYKSNIQNRVATADRWVDILGITVFQYSAEMRYSHNGSTVTRIDHANIWISRNLFPFTTSTWGNKSTYGVGTSTATHIDYCTWSFTHPSLGLTFGTHQIEITGNVRNQTNFWIR